jgi:hypothetical protein
MIFSCRKPDRIPRQIKPARERAQMADGRPRSIRDEMKFEYGQRLSLGPISPHLLTVSTHLGAQRRAHRRGLLVGRDVWPDTHPTRQSFGTARRIRLSRKPLGLNP